MGYENRLLSVLDGTSNEIFQCNPRIIFTLSIVLFVYFACFSGVCQALTHQEKKTSKAYCTVCLCRRFCPEDKVTVCFIH